MPSGYLLTCRLPEAASPVLRVMAEAADRAANGLLTSFSDVDALSVTEKAAGDFVSEADVRAEAVIREVLTAAYPNFGWVGEESEAVEVDGLRWIVDPLDGTTNFLKGLPHWAVSIALAEGDVVLAGLVFDPVKVACYTAEVGKGAFLNGQRMRVSSGVPLSAALFATGVPNGARVAHLNDCLAELGRLMPDCAGIRRGGAAALDLAYVAAGRFEGYWERNLGPWDVAAGVLLVAEAGGRVAPLWEGTTVLETGSFVAANAELLEPLTGYLETGRR